MAYQNLQFAVSPPKQEDSRARSSGATHRGLVQASTGALGEVLEEEAGLPHRR